MFLQWFRTISMIDPCNEFKGALGEALFAGWTRQARASRSYGFARRITRAGMHHSRYGFPLRPIQTKRNLEANVDLDGQNNRSNNGPWSKNLRGPWLAITGDAGTPCQRGIWGQIQMVEEKLGLTAPTRSCEQLTRQ